jgi:hypothetical protein
LAPPRLTSKLPSPAGRMLRAAVQHREHPQGWDGKPTSQRTQAKLAPPLRLKGRKAGGALAVKRNRYTYMPSNCGGMAATAVNTAAIRTPAAVIEVDPGRVVRKSFCVVMVGAAERGAAFEGATARSASPLGLSRSRPVCQHCSCLVDGWRAVRAPQSPRQQTRVCTGNPAHGPWAGLTPRRGPAHVAVAVYALHGPRRAFPASLHTCRMSAHGLSRKHALRVWPGQVSRFCCVAASV